MSTESALRIVWIYPDLLSTYGDRGNLLILARRADLRGLPVEAIEVRSDEPVPERADIYLLGGGEDGPQALAAQRLNADRGLHKAVDRRAVVFCVCAGYQLLGTSFSAKGEKHAGLDLLDVSSDRGSSRAVGEIVGEIDPELGLPTLTGFENHGGRTHVGPQARPLARVTAGIGNDGRTEGAWQGSVLGTYSHGPALARNPALADLLLAWATGMEQLDPIDDTWPDRLRGERLASVKASGAAAGSKAAGKAASAGGAVSAGGAASAGRAGKDATSRGGGYVPASAAAMTTRLPGAEPVAAHRRAVDTARPAHGAEPTEAGDPVATTPFRPTTR